MKFIWLLCFCIMTSGVTLAQEVMPAADTLPTGDIAITLPDESISAQTPAPEQEPEVATEVMFSPNFMKNLLYCKPDFEEDDKREVEILGVENNRCHLTYANFDLKIPLTLLSNVRSFENVETLLKNKDIANYNYRADYIYDGLMYAVDACHKKKNYEGRDEELADDYVSINRGLNSEFINGMCSIYLRNLQNIDGVTTDYGVTCRLPYKVVEALEPYFKDLAQKYGEKQQIDAGGQLKIIRAQTNKKTKEADIALMYYLQKNGYCQKNTR